MTKQEREYVQKLEKLNELLKERIQYLENRLSYEDPVKAANSPDGYIKF